MSDSKSTRRSILKKLGVGAVSVPALSGVSSATSMKEPDSFCDDDENPRKGHLYIARDDKQNDRDPIEYDVKVISGRESTDVRPITVEVSITNKLDSTISIADVEEAFFYGQMSKDQSFILLPAGAPKKYYSSLNGCWMLDQGYFTEESFDMLPVEPGETITKKLYVLHTRKNVFRTCLDYPDKIRFPDTECYVFYMIGGHGTSVSWGFSLNEVSIWDEDPIWHPPLRKRILEEDVEKNTNSNGENQKGTKS